MLEKKPEIESVISAGKHIAMEMHWPQGMDGLRTQYVSMRDRWAKVWRESEEWERLLEAVYPEMQHFQVQYVGLRILHVHYIGTYTTPH